MQLLLHALGVGPVRTCVDKDLSEYPESLNPQEMMQLQQQQTSGEVDLVIFNLR